ncbi:UNVERIFIED_CONTAM: hypothetical protein Slati_0110600 [Sesamum latifolium]|uniref:Uncharacterized protein n=1 Tax=Sesamum latifolium TaxID=2727402 RepID=A0AAW2Y8Z9_9LAMI
MGGAPISWKTKKHATISRSTAEAEYQSMASVVCELTWVTSLVQELHIWIEVPVAFFCDSKQQYILRKIQFFMNEQSTWRLIVTLFVQVQSRFHHTNAHSIRAAIGRFIHKTTSGTFLVNFACQVGIGITHPKSNL